MQRGRGRPNRQSQRGGRGGNINSNNSPRPPRPRPEYASVPPIRTIYQGCGVSIILKEDQQSGHQVKGIVADILTRGDHPRGVKVRLRDGRVGRVQGLVSEIEGQQGEAVVGGPEANLGRNGEDGTGAGRGGRRRGGGGGGGEGRMERDIREDDEYLYENRIANQDHGMFAALEEADKMHEQSRTGPPIQSFLSEGITSCPVCFSFEGDEAAVAHHVEQHFAD